MAVAGVSTTFFPRDARMAICCHSVLKDGFSLASGITERNMNNGNSK
jgi:hypothetical protein